MSIQCGLPEDETKTEFQDKYVQDKFESFDKNLKLPIFLHSEIRMIDYLIKENIHEVHDNDVEIGISKLPCYLCSLYIQKLNITHNRNFHIGSSITEGKIYPNWMFRNNEQDQIINGIKDQIDTLMKKELQLLQLRIRNKSGDSDKQETELDDDDVNYQWMLRDLDKFLSGPKLCNVS